MSTAPLPSHPARGSLAGVLVAANLLNLAVVASVTLGPRGLVARARSWVVDWVETVGAPLSIEVTTHDVEFVGNVLLFVPVAALLALAVRRGSWLVGTVGGVAVSLVIELIQTRLPGRVTDPEDVVANALGALVGATVVSVVRLIARR